MVLKLFFHSGLQNHPSPVSALPGVYALTGDGLMLSACAASGRQKDETAGKKTTCYKRKTVRKPIAGLSRSFL